MQYLIIIILTLIVSYRLFKKAAGSLSLINLNMISWIFYYNIIVQSFIAAILVVYEVDFHYFIGKMHSNISRVYGFYSIMYTAISLPLGMILCNKLLTGRYNNVFFKEYVNKKISYHFYNREFLIRLALGALTCLSMLSVIYVFISIRSFPLLSALSGGKNVEQLASIRNEVGREFGGMVYIKNFFALKLMPLLSYIYYVYYRFTKNKKIQLWFIITVVFSFLILTYNLEKSPVLEYFIGFFFIRVLLGEKINFMKLIKLGLIFIVILVSIYLLIFNQPVESLLNYNTGFVGRLILGQSAGTFLSFDLFPGYRQHIGFSSISSFISSFFELEHSERSARLIMEFYNPRGVEEGTAGVVNSLFIGEAWANFGFLGVILSPFYVGFLAQFINLYLLKQNKTPIYLGLLAFLSYNIPITGGINDFIYNPIYILIFVSIFFTISWSKTLTA